MSKKSFNGTPNSPGLLPSSSLVNNSLTIRQEIQRFESVHPSIYAIYDLIELIPDVQIAQQIRDHVVCIEVQGRSISSQIEDAIRDIQEKMPCGFPGLGIGPLAPAHVSKKEGNFSGKSFAVEGQVNDVVLYKLNEFDILKCTANALTSRVRVTLRWDEIVSHIESYKMKSHVEQRGLTVNVLGDGVVDFILRGLKVECDIKYKLGLISRKLKITTLKVIITLEDVTSEITGLLGNGFVNHKLNEIIEEFVLLGINDNQEEITKAIEDNLKPLINDYLNNHPIDDLLGGGGNGNSNANTECVPPQQ